MFVLHPLDSVHEEQRQHDDKYQAKDTTRSEAP